jgi:hypothetical protein
MAALNEKQIVAGVLLFAFLVLIMLSVQFMQDSSGNVLIKETFTSLGPTRASDCQCLPGYIPSKSGRADVKLVMFWNRTTILYTDTWAKVYYYHAEGPDRIMNSINTLLRCMGLNRSYEYYDDFTKDIENGSIPNCLYLSTDKQYEEIMSNKAIADIFKVSLNDVDSKFLHPNTVCSALQALPSTNKNTYSCMSLGDSSTKPCY